jgi:hydrogenase-4 membrane subunit HyfE
MYNVSNVKIAQIIGYVQLYNGRSIMQLLEVRIIIAELKCITWVVKFYQQKLEKMRVIGGEYIAEFAVDSRRHVFSIIIGYTDTHTEHTGKRLFAFW